MTIVLLFKPMIAVAQSDGLDIGERFQRLTRSAAWTEIDTISLQFDAHHPQGMTLIGDHIYVSSVEVINRREGAGKGHLFEIDRSGALVRSLELSDGAAYHPGGMDYDGEAIWLPVAEYRPDSRTVVYAVDPETWVAREVFAYNDHLGALVHDRHGTQLVGVSWGSRRFYRWPVTRKDGAWTPDDPEHPITTRNPSHYVDYQDMQALSGTSLVMCGGLARIREQPAGGTRIALGGIDLIECASMRTVHQLPVPLWTSSGAPYTRNPFYVEAREDRLRFYFLPKDGRGTIYVVDAGA